MALEIVAAEKFIATIKCITNLFFMFSVNGCNSESDRLELFHDPGPDGLNSQASETPV